MTDVVLTLNAGSSSFKFAAFDRADAARPALLRGTADRSQDAVRIAARDSAGHPLPPPPARKGGGTEALVETLFRLLEQQGHSDRLCAVGHRIVHGGDRFADPVLLDPETIAAIEALTPLAPLHQPAGLAPVRAVAALRPELPQVACFDTAFHRTMGPTARRYALPRACEAEGIRRYGFHGLSFAYIAEVLRGSLAADDWRTVVAHLGSGCSLCAMKEGKSIDTTMGFTALDGLMMATRPGSLDPGILLYLLQEKRMAADAIEELLYRRSGLLGVSGITGDVRKLLASGGREAAEALDLFVHRLVQEIAAMAASLGGVDLIVFTGGIGEHAAPIREAVCKRLRWLGISLDEEANRTAAPLISGSASRIAVRVIPTDEETMIAGGVRAVLGGA